jgi:hypothetical protein
MAASVTSRFASNLALVVAGSVLACAALGLTAEAAARVALGLGVLALLAVLIAFAFRGRGPVQRCFDAAAIAAGAWTIVAASVSGGTTAMWLAFANGCLLALIGLGGLVAHETTMELALRRPRPVPSPRSATPGEDGVQAAVPRGVVSA